MIEKKLFESFNGKEIFAYTLNSKKLKVEILNYGGIVRKVCVLKNDEWIDVALGYNSIKEYNDYGGYLGAIIGRVCNRIDSGRFIFHGKEYRITTNDNGNTLHGGIEGFNAKVWDAEIRGDKLVLSMVSADGDQGFMGNLNVSVSYSITEENGLKIEYDAVSDKDTVVSLTNHTYFNLSGEGRGTILDTDLFIDSSKITPISERLITDNTFMDILNTPLDFSISKKIGRDIDKENDQLKNGGGYDFNYVLNGSGFRKVATAVSDKTNIKMDVYTDRIGLQFYSGNFLDGSKGKSGIYNKRDGFCLETQSFPNALNCPLYPSIELKKGERYSASTEYRFN